MKEICEYLFNLRWEVSIQENKTCLGLKLAIIFIKKKRNKTQKTLMRLVLVLERGLAFELFVFF